jgi:hypothetical protein
MRALMRLATEYRCLSASSSSSSGRSGTGAPDWTRIEKFRRDRGQHHRRATPPCPFSRDALVPTPLADGPSDSTSPLSASDCFMATFVALPYNYGFEKNAGNW